jgi:hypothetical protein
MKPDPRQITNLSALAGKTVARATFLDGWDELAVVFTDGTFLYVDIEFGYNGGGELTIFGAADFNARRNMGLATEAEIDADRIARERAAADAARIKERRDREEYERLKAKFDKKIL